MRKKLLKWMYLLMVIGLMLGLSFTSVALETVNADTTDYVEAEFSVMTWNVGDLAGTLTDQEEERIVRAIEAIHPQIVGLQEDFKRNIWDRLKQNRTYSYDIMPTYAPWPKPHGNGLAMFTDLTLGYQETVEWDACHGIISDLLDCDAAKGFTFAHLFAPTLDHRYYKIHFYNLHADAGTGFSDDLARQHQLDQLCVFMNQHSAGEAVIVVGDFNIHHDSVTDQNNLDWFIGQQGLQMSCPENQATHEGGEKFDYILYRSGDKVELEILKNPENGENQCSVCKYYENEDGNWVSLVGLSDHYPVKADFRVRVHCGPLPDLRITDIWFETTNSYAEPEKVYATIKNFGPSATPAGEEVTTDIWVQGIYCGSFDVEDSNGNFKTLGSGESYTGIVIMPDEFLTSGFSDNMATLAETGATALVKAVADSKNYIPELDRTNNTLEKSLPLRWLTLEYPLGGEEFIKGETITINWTYSGLRGDIELSLIKGSSVQVPIGQCSIQAGSYNWTVTHYDYGEDSDYKIKIATVDGEYSDHSSFFTISCVPFIDIDNSDPAASSYNYGDTITLHYSADCLTNDVRFVLRRINSTGGLLENYTLGYGEQGFDKTITFTIPYDCVSPGLCNIKAKADGIYDLSKNFTLENPEIKNVRILPETKSTFNRGETIKIQWTIEGISERMRVVLRRITSSGALIEAKTLWDVNPQPGITVYQKSYTIPQSETPGLYNVKVKAQGVYDLSRKITIQ